MTDSQGPLIPASKLSKTNYTSRLKIDTLLCSTLTNGSVIIASGRITGLEDPTDNQDACTKNYVDTTLNTVSEPLNSIQYNNDTGSFGGNADLTYNINTGLLYSKNTYIGINPVTGSSTTSLVIENGTIKNIYNTVSGTRSSLLITKSYVDTYDKYTKSNNSDLAITYSASDMTNNLLIRNPSESTTDTTCDATTLVNRISSTISALVGTTCRFDLYNTSTHSVLTVNAGAGLSIYPTTSSLQLYPEYKLISTIVSTSPSSAQLLVESMTYAKSNNNFVIGPRSLYTTSNVIRVSDTYRFNTDIIEYTDSSVIYSPSDILSVIERKYVGAKTDTFGDITTFISSFYTINSPLYNIFQTGAVEIVIKNTSSSGNLTLVEDVQGHWTMDPNSNMVIGPGKTGYFYLYVDVENQTGNVYVISLS